MESYTFKRFEDDEGHIKSLEINGMLVLENAVEIKRSLLSVAKSMSNHLNISISEVHDIDLSFIQLLLAFITEMDEKHVSYSFEWNLDDYQKSLLENVGLSSDLYINN